MGLIQGSLMKHLHAKAGEQGKMKTWAGLTWLSGFWPWETVLPVRKKDTKEMEFWDNTFLFLSLHFCGSFFLSCRTF